MDKKVTVRDIAREAGVSVATVSYVLNDRIDQKISPETRKKVLQIANLLNYRPSHAAKSLATGRNNIIGIAYNTQNNSYSRNFEISVFCDLLIERLNRMKYDVLYVPFMNTEENLCINSNIDAIIAIDLTYDQFRRLADRYLVPVIAVDMLINDHLFYQIYTDYPSMIAKATKYFNNDYYLVLDGFANLEFQNFIIGELSPKRVINFSENTKKDLYKLKDKNVVVIGSYLSHIILPYADKNRMAVITSQENDFTLLPEIRIINNDISKKANIAINVLLNSLDRNFDLNHDLKVL